MYKLKTNEIAARIGEIANMEAYTLIDLEATDLECRTAKLAHLYLGKALARSALRHATRSGQSAQSFLEDLKADVIDGIDRVTSIALRRAMTGCRLALRTDVTYKVMTDSDGSQPEVVMYAAENVDNDWFTTLLHSAIRIRSEPVSRQRMASRLTQMISTRRELGWSSSNQDDRHVEQELGQVRDICADLESRLPPQVRDNTQDFEFSWFRGLGGYPSLPRVLDADETPQELREVATHYDAFGSALRFMWADRVRGKLAQRRQATLGWIQFHGAAQAIRIAGCWLRALSLGTGERHCPICYRHAGRRVRCFEHSTERSETPAARLGRRIRPHYLEGLDRLLSSKTVKMALKPSPQVAAEGDLWLQEALDGFRSTEALRQRALQLARQLRAYRPLLSQHQMTSVEVVFNGFLNSASQIPRFMDARTLAERRASQEAMKAALEQLSPKGFFKHWYGPPPDTEKNNPPAPGLRVDRCHPLLADGPLELPNIPRELVMHRAWHEAESALVSDLMPSPEAIANMIEQGKSVSDIAMEFRVSRQTIWKLRKRTRARNRLSR